MFGRLKRKSVEPFQRLSDIPAALTFLTLQRITFITMPRHIFSSESVTEGHPDKVCDTISDYVLDACLEQDPKSRVACETLAKGNLIVLAGEITSNAKLDFEERVRAAVRDIGYVNGDCIFHADTCRVIWEMSEQSRDIKQGVDEAPADGKAT